jgi:hypothetical protein
MTEPIVADLAGHVLAPDGPLLRDHVRKPKRRSAHYMERYDRTTLFYDCVRLPDRGSYLFSAPRMLNLRRPFLDGLRIGGQKPQRVRRRVWLRCEQIEVTAPESAVTIDMGDGPVRIAARPSVAETFAGRRSLLAVNKNNALDWIEDWASFYARAHGADAVVLFDNGSTDYDAQDIADRLSRVSGIAQTAVFRAPYPYGPTDGAKPLEISPRFFQTGMLNIARREALSRAAGVLSVDIDEIARSTDGSRLFDMAARHPLGMVTIQGSWVYPEPGTAGAVGHGAHAWRRDPDRKCNRKWCLRPDGLMSRFGWAVHQIGGVAQNLFTNQNRVGLLHCFGTSTGWKAKRLELPAPLKHDPELAQFMTTEFPDRPERSRALSPEPPAPETFPAATS